MVSPLNLIQPFKPSPNPAKPPAVYHPWLQAAQLTPAAPPVYKPQPQATQPKAQAPTVYRPQIQGSQLRPIAPPPVYRPQPTSNQMKPAAQVKRTAPAVYRPTPFASQAKFARHVHIPGSGQSGSAMPLPKMRAALPAPRKVAQPFSATIQRMHAATSGVPDSSSVKLPLTGESAIELNQGTLLALLTILDENPDIVLAHLDEFYPLFLKLRASSKALFCKVHQCFGISFARFAYRSQGNSFTFSNKAQFLFSNPPFPAFKRAKRVKNNVEPFDNLKASWSKYHPETESSDRAYIERISDKHDLFDTSVDKKGGVYPEPLMKTRRLLDATTWSPEINDSWALGRIHRRQTFHMVSEPSDENLFDDKLFTTGLKEKVVFHFTVLGRELCQLLLAGYTAAAYVHHAADEVQGGLLLEPPSTPGALVELDQIAKARVDDLKILLRDFQTDAKKLYQAVTK